LDEKPIPSLRADWLSRQAFPEDSLREIETIPEGVTKGAPPEIYGGFRRGLHGACCDIVIATTLPSGEDAVLLSFRNANVCFGSTWWVYGGAVHAYRDIGEFISERASKECGVEVEPQALVGFYITNAADHIGSTMQPCYMSYVEYEVIDRNMLADSNHSNVRLFTLRDLEMMPEQERHWYPLRVSKRVLAALGHRLWTEE
jgi:hypothetical protein